MRSTCSTAIFLDTRRLKKDNTYPVKLRVTFQRKSRYYDTDYSMTESDFETIMKSEKLRGEKKDIKFDLMNTEDKAMTVIEEMSHFSFPAFEKKFLGPSYQKGDVFAKYQEYINRLEKNDQIGTASAYRCSMKSLYKFLVKFYNLKTMSFPFTEINENLLQEYENYMINELESSYSTVGIYLRPLRTLFNNAKEDGDIPADHYPFGKRKYQIPAATNNKRPLSGEEMKKLLETPADQFEEKARDFWFLSYLCNGVNMHDIAEMKFETNLQATQIIFFREKTKRTHKTNLKQIVVQLVWVSHSIIEKYRNTDTKKGNYVFAILQPGMTATEKKRAIQNFTRFVNQHIKRLATKAGLGKDISTYWARHSFSNTMQNNGASIELISESVGHSSIKTTANYLSGFKVEKKQEMAEKLMDFMKE